MVLSTQLFKASCGSISRMATFASLDPLFGTPSGNPSQYLKQHNFSGNDVIAYYKEALQKGAYMLELGFKESEGIEDKIFTPYMDQIDDDQEEVREKIITICKKLREKKIIEELLQELDSSQVEKALLESGMGKDVFPIPDSFIFYLNKISGYATDDNAINLLVGKKLLFCAIDYHLRFSLLTDARLKSMSGVNSFTKTKLRLNLVAKQITVKEKQKQQSDSEGNASLSQTLTQEIALYKNALEKMTGYVNQYAEVLLNLYNSIANMHQHIGQEVLEKVYQMKVAPQKESKDTGSIATESAGEVIRLTKQAMELLGEDRIEFSHNLLGTVLQEQKPKIEKARTFFEQLPNTHPQKPILANRLGVILNAMGMPDKAAEYFRRALVLLPGSKKKERSPIENNLFYALLNRGSFDAALKYMLESIDAGMADAKLFDVERYVPKKILGVGGMGVSFLCEDVYEERMVTVKTLWRYATGSIKATFSEAFTAKKINDPRIVKIYDIGKHSNRPYIVMEYCEGTDLQKYISIDLNNKPLEALEALHIILEVAKGIQAAHNQTPPIIHRDIKPNNILYNKDAKEVKIIDFGIACMLPPVDKISRSVTSFTGGGVIAQNMAGTWGYMAPEQQRGEKQLDARTDIFSLGKTLMFLLTAKTPPPENIFALSPATREHVGELVGYCLMPHANERYNIDQVIQKIEEIKENIVNVPIQPAVLATEVTYDAVEAIEASPVEEYEMQAIEANPVDEGIIELANLASDTTLEAAAVAATPISDMDIPEPAQIVNADIADSSMESSVTPLFDSASFAVAEEVTPVNLSGGMDLSAGADLSAGTDLSGGMDLSAGTDLSGGMDLSAGTDLSGGMDLSAGTDLSGGMDLSAGTDLSGGMDLSAGADLSAGTDLSGGMDLSAGADLSAGTDLSGGMDLSAGADLSAGTDLSGGMDLSAGADLSAGTDFSGGMDLTDGDDLSTNTNLSQGTDLLGAGDLNDFQTMDDDLGGVSYGDDMSDLGAVSYGDDNDLENRPDILVGEVQSEGSEGLRPNAPLPKVELPTGYIWEGDIVICEKDGATMIYVPSGLFLMGNEDEGHTFAEAPEHEINLDGYLIDECPVTWYQYLLFCEETSREKPLKPCWELDEAQPVINVTWEDAEAYAQWAGKTLPTEAQWEKAAKGGFYYDGDDNMMHKNTASRRKYAWGHDQPNVSSEWLANCSGEPQYGDRSPSPVGLFMEGASPYGCLDMTGNVWEWCIDWYNDTYYGTCPKSNPKGPKNGPGRIIRGGAWNSKFEHISTTYRGYMEPDQAWNIIGFRTVQGIVTI